jgi:hypothetical protein
MYSTRLELICVSAGRVVMGWARPAPSFSVATCVTHGAVAVEAAGGAHCGDADWPTSRRQTLPSWSAP